MLLGRQRCPNLSSSVCLIFLHAHFIGCFASYVKHVADMYLKHYFHFFGHAHHANKSLPPVVFFEFWHRHNLESDFTVKQNAQHSGM